ncbi:hypothetical protein DITRI_Ditri15bG0016500 [Diplodiscus trichospermus]
MAEAIISAAAEVTLSKAISIVEELINLRRGFKDELNNLIESLTMTRAFLKDDAETRKVDEPLGVWLKQLRKIASKADDVLDEFAYEDLRRKAETQMRKKVSNFFSISKNPIVFSFKMSQIVKGINISLKKINDRAREFGLEQRVHTLPPLPRGSQATHSFVDSSQVVGRKADVSNIIDLLIRSSSQQTFSIISIVGMGGLGKTTLAKSICNSEQTTRYFDKIMWVCVSEDFDVERILQEMFQSLTGQKCDMTNRSAILERIQKELEGTYLLALDDVWDEDFRTWEDLRGSLLGINKNIRSSILVTTRSANIAIVRDTPQENRYSLMPLGDDECFEIIRNRAFPNSSISSELEVIGRDIARKCGGVPLVANVIGGTMSNKWDIDEWVSLRDGSHWGSLGKNEEIVDVLRLSFDRLSSSSLKQCFVYCSIFPKDYLIEKDQLIQLWMAEGFLQQPERNSELTFEDIGNEYFNSLLSNSLLQDVLRDLRGSIIGCKMHDLVHDLAQSIRNIGTNNASHIQLQNEFDGEKLWHSLFSKSNFFHIKADFKYLRVLNFSGARLNSLPESIGRLKHLRHLDVSRTFLRRLPKSITHLYHLQTLRLLWCSALREFPKRLKNLVNLRHLVINYKWQLFEEIKYLTNLRTLPIFDVGTKRCGIGALGYLSELGGELKIYNLQNVRNREDAHQAKIWEKDKLHTLIYSWYHGQGESYSNDALEGLEHHSNLKSLTIEFYMGDNNPSWLVRNSAPSAYFQPINLAHLSLRYCKKLKNVPTFGLYPNLRFLEIQGLNNVRCIGNEFYINYNNGGDIKLFPALDNFKLCNMEELKEWLDMEATIGVFPSLKKLKIEECPNLTNIPAMTRFSSLEELSISKCEKLCLIGDGLFPSTLKKLKIFMCEKLSSIPSTEGGISFLQQLEVKSCRELSKIGEGLLASSCLRDVWISRCFNLRSIPLNPGSQSLLKFQLKGCDELREIEGGLSACTGLENLCIEDCPNLISIPSVDGFSSFLCLSLWGRGGLTSLPSGLRTCTSLRELDIFDCTNLKSIPEDVGQLHSLRELRVRDCHNLKSFPEQSLGCLTRLKILELGPFSEELEEFPGLSSIHHLQSSLEELTLTGWEKLSFLPDQLQHLTALKTLLIGSFSEVKALPEWLGNLSSLRELYINDCENLGHLPSKEAMQRLSNLKTLEWGSFSREQEEFPGLSSIHHLYSFFKVSTLKGKLSFLPDQLQHLTALERLMIRSFSGVKALPEWLGNLSSLRELYIKDCENLGHLPSKEAMQRLSNLQNLQIRNCPLLEKNSTEQSKISHIPKRSIY